MDLSFFASPRFYALLLGAAGTVLLAPSFGTQPWYVSLGTFLQILSGGFIAIKTVDRATEVLSSKKLPDSGK